MKNRIKSFRLYVRPDEKSRMLADEIRQLNSEKSNPLEESENGDLVIAIGGDGTFINAVMDTNFSKDKIYTGVNKGTLGFMQDLSEQDILSLIKYIEFEQELKVRKVYVSLVKVFLTNGNILEYFALNEVLVSGQNQSKISFEEHLNGEFLQNVSGSGIVISTSTGDTALSMSAGGAIDFSKNIHLVCTLDKPIKNIAFGNFIANTLICDTIKLKLKPAENICIIIDGRKKDIDSSLIESVEVSIDDKTNYFNKLDLRNYSKVRVVREKILGN